MIVDKRHPPEVLKFLCVFVWLSKEQLPRIPCKDATLNFSNFASISVLAIYTFFNPPIFLIISSVVLRAATPSFSAAEMTVRSEDQG